MMTIDEYLLGSIVKNNRKVALELTDKAKWAIKEGTNKACGTKCWKTNSATKIENKRYSSQLIWFNMW